MKAERLIIAIAGGVLALVVTYLGLQRAQDIARERPATALATTVRAIAMPVIVTARIDWRSGFQAGQSMANPDGITVSGPEKRDGCP